MSTFTIRVLLYGGEADHYRALKERMQRYGAVSVILCCEGEVYDLPEGEFNLIRPIPLEQVLDEVADLANGVLPGSSVLVTEGERAWRLPRKAAAA